MRGKRFFGFLTLFLLGASIYTLIESFFSFQNGAALAAKTLLYSFSFDSQNSGEPKLSFAINEFSKILGDTANNAMAYPMPDGNRLTILTRVYREPAKNSHLDPERNYLNWTLSSFGDTLYFKDRLAVEIYENDALHSSIVLNAYHLQNTLAAEWRSVYTLLSAECAAYHLDKARFILKLNYGLPGDTVARALGFAALDHEGRVKLQGRSDVCDGALTITPDYILTCREIISLNNENRQTFAKKTVAVAQMLDDSVFVVVNAVEENPTSPFNAHIFTPTLDTLFSFNYEGYRFDGAYHSAIGVSPALQCAGFLNEELGELVVFSFDDFAEPLLYKLKSLPILKDDTVARPSLGLSSIVINGEKKYRFYFSSSKKIIGYSIIDTDKPTSREATI